MEIKGPYPSSTLMYIHANTLQGFVVNNRASTIELLFVSGFPSKIIDFTSGYLTNAVELLTDFIAQKPSSMSEPGRRRVEFDGKDFQERLSYIESVLNKVPTIQQETSTLSSSVEQIYEMSMQLRSDLEAMKKVDVDDAITEVECNENDACDCECYAEKPEVPTPTQCAPTPFELFLAFMGTGLMLAGFAARSMPVIQAH
jgi:hypothetical protein